MDGLSFQIGLVAVVLFIFSLFVIAKNSNKKRAVTVFFFVLSLVIVFLMFDISLPAWKTFGLASVAQFPWRLLTLTMVSFSIVGGTVMLLDGRSDESGEVSTTQDFLLYSGQAQGRMTDATLNAPLAMIVLAARTAGSYPYITAKIFWNPKKVRWAWRA